MKIENVTPPTEKIFQLTLNLKELLRLKSVLRFYSTHKVNNIVRVCESIDESDLMLNDILELLGLSTNNEVE